MSSTEEKQMNEITSVLQYSVGLGYVGCAWNNKKKACYFLSCQCSSPYQTLQRTQCKIFFWSFFSQHYTAADTAHQNSKLNCSYQHGHWRHRVSWKRYFFFFAKNCPCRCVCATIKLYAKLICMVQPIYVNCHSLLSDIRVNAKIAGIQFHTRL